MHSVCNATGIPVIHPLHYTPLRTTLLYKDGSLMRLMSFPCRTGPKQVKTGSEWANATLEHPKWSMANGITVRKPQFVQ